MTADTNVLVYAYDLDEPDKQRMALAAIDRLIELRQPIGLQAISEFQSALRRKLKAPIWKAVEQATLLLEAFDHFPPTSTSVAGALTDFGAGHFSYWDALLVRSAAEHGCTVMFTEDMRSGARPFGVELVNPFDPDVGAPRARELLEL
jgi:predicted nucleic acid-binding protein